MDMTRGGIPVVAQDHFDRPGLASMSRRSRKKSGGGSSMIPDWMSKQIGRMTETKGTRAAEKLKRMSTGSMQGFGPDGGGSAALQSSSTDMLAPKPTFASQ